MNKLSQRNSSKDNLLSDSKENTKNIRENHRATSRDFQCKNQRAGGEGGADVVGGAVEVAVVVLTGVRPVVIAAAA